MLAIGWPRVPLPGFASTTSTLFVPGRVTTARLPSGVIAIEWAGDAERTTAVWVFWVRSMVARPPSPTTNTVRPLGESATSVGVKLSDTGPPTALGDACAGAGSTVKLKPLLVSAPKAARIGPVVAPAGTRTTREPDESTDGVTVRVVSPVRNSTALAAALASKPEPKTVISAPGGVAGGTIEVIVTAGFGSVVKPVVNAAASGTPLASVNWVSMSSR